MSHRLFADSATASGVRWLVISLMLAAVGDLVLDVPYYFGTAIPGLAVLSGRSPYRLYSSVLSVALPTIIGPIGFVGIFRIERGRGWTGEWRGGGGMRAVVFLAAGAEVLIASWGVLGLWRVPIEATLNSFLICPRVPLVRPCGGYLLTSPAR